MKNLFLWCGQFSENKFWELQMFWVKPYLKHFEVTLFEYDFDYKHIARSTIDLLGLIGLNIQYTTHRDHAGFYSEFRFLGLEFIFTIYDCRHWDVEKNRWCA